MLDRAMRQLYREMVAEGAFETCGHCGAKGHAVDLCLKLTRCCGVEFDEDAGRCPRCGENCK